MIVRVYIAAACMLAVSIGLVARLGYIYLVEKDFLQDQGDARTIRMERINAHRGMIRDRQGKPMAVSSPVMSLWANPKDLTSDMEQLVPLAEHLGVSVEAFLDRMDEVRNREFVYLRRHLPPPEARKIMSLGVPGVFQEKEYHRYYPAGEVAAHLVGYTNIDDRGQEGLELSFDKWLAGSPGRIKVVKDRHGEIVRDPMPVSDAEPGQNLDLSIDLRLQYFAYRELKTATTHLKAESGTVVILDVATGRILAMVNQPSYNPNNKDNVISAAIRNRAVTDVFEPGSTMKPFTVAVALQAGYPVETEFDTHPGTVMVGNFTVKDPLDYGVLDLRGIIVKSSQVGISKLALTLDEYDVWALYQQVGFGQTTGFGFPGERSGSLPNHRRWSDVERVNFAYGYGLTVTPLQLASAYLTIASGGIKRGISLHSGGDVTETRVLNENIANNLRVMLMAVVTEGTGTKAAIPDYLVAGKTGTVRKLSSNGKYSGNRHLTFFAGMAPAEDPRLVAVVLIDEPGIQGGGGTIAAPIFSKIVSGALRLLDVPPNFPDTELPTAELPVADSRTVEPSNPVSTHAKDKAT